MCHIPGPEVILFFLGRGGGWFVHMLVCSLRLNNLPTRFLDSIRHYMSNTTLGRLFLFNGLFDEELV